MHERITIRNFLVVQHAALELKKINILIGPQAGGKSIIAKLCYLFRKMSARFLAGIRMQVSKEEVDNNILKGFESCFPRYAWEDAEFEIHYEIGNLFIEIRGRKNTKGKTRLVLKYSEGLHRIFSAKKKLYKNKFNNMPVEQNSDALWRREIIVPLQLGEYGNFFSNSIFIPASRSFFANLQKNIFTFMASNVDIDPFLKDFDSLYEMSKRIYKTVRQTDQKDALFADRSASSVAAIIHGEYVYEDGQDRITDKGRRVNLAHASSGQQESLPMLIVLSVLPSLNREDRASLCFIEEPEAHLFPTSQSYVISMLSHLYKEANAGFFLTSHSPYILSALNNHILADEVVAAGTLTPEEYTRLNGHGVPIPFADVAAYTLSQGKTSSLSDEEYKMIGADMLDGVSDRFNEVADRLLERLN